MSKCKFCNSDVTFGDGEFPVVHCPVCGKYRILYKLSLDLGMYKIDKESFRNFLYYHKADNKVYYIGTKEDIDEFPKNQLSQFNSLVSKEEIQNWSPVSINDKIDLILLAFGRRAKFVGDTIFIHKYTDDALLFITQNDIKEDDLDICTDIQAKFILNAMCDLGYIKYGISESSMYFARAFEITILAKGYSRIYELQKNQVNNKNVFIAMSFNPAIEKIYNAIDSAIKQAECEVVSMKHRIHNKQIVPEMLRLIKESKILVMDISEPNFGAYYEAGYAQGLGKEVIFTCKSSVMNKDKFPCSDKKGKECEFLKKYSKPHFDIAQKQILVWEDEADLTEQLTEWIKFLKG